ncbi:MFS transporter [Paenibacillus sp. FSL H7-0331]|uniref:MFS transporter n=1 Tax=Paenibacillus sp. FSL H7-0331 TaxID=1920421 RepID=UPI00096D9480|nr:MFS transporter [Paenibacillus sp. FSL H7-0331]OMF10753.1 MFS transporter [Paenibacillus sp. FSL H7-0331]
MITRLGSGVKNWVDSRRLHIPAEKRLSKDATTSLFIHFCFQFGASMSGVFLTLYLWRLTHSLWINGMYNIINYAVAPFAFMLGGLLIKKKDRMVTYRFGIALIALFYLVVVLAQERVVDYYVLFAIFGGMAGAFYWAGYLTLMYDVSTEQNRIRYLAMNMIVFTLAGLIGPALAGYIIRQNNGLQGYTIVFSIAFLMFLMAAVGSLRIKTKATHHKAYYLKYVGLLMNKNRLWFKSLFCFSILGILQGMMMFLPSILLFKIVEREDLVGYLGMLYASLGIATGMYISRYGRDGWAGRFIIISTIGCVAGSLLLVWKLNLYTVILFMILYSICAPLQGNTITSYYFRIMGTLPLKGQLRVESVVMRETFVNVGRIVAIFVLIILNRYTGDWTLPWVLLGASIVQIGIYWLIEPLRQTAADSAAD